MPLKKIQIFYFLFISYTALAFAYVIFPNFHDHIESSVSILSYSLLTGGALYPDDQVWPYSMLVYGPYLFIFQSFILSTSMPIIEASKQKSVTFICQNTDLQKFAKLNCVKCPPLLRGKI